MSQYLSTLPPEILLEVCEQLCSSDLANLVCTSKFFARIGTPRLYNTLIYGPVARKFSFGRLKSKFAVEYFHKNCKSLLATRGSKGRWLLHYIAASGNRRLLRVLLANGADVSVRDNHGETPLHVALEKKQEAMALALLEAGADVCGLAKGRPILAFVHENMSSAVVEKVIAAIQSAGESISSSGTGGYTALHYASRRGDYRVVDMLIGHGADVFAACEYGHIPLVYAIVKRRVAAIKLLLEAMQADSRGYEINGPIASPKDIPKPWAPERISRFYETGDTILHTAVGTWSEPIVQLLLDYGADPLAENNPGYRPGRTPFDIAVQGRCPELVTLLASMQDPPQFWKSNGYIQEGFEISVGEAYVGTVRTLVELYKQEKVDIDISAAGPGMLQVCKYYHAGVADQDINDTVVSVLSMGVDINYQNEEGKTALHILSESADEPHNAAVMRLMEHLLDCGANWRICDGQGNTALHALARTQSFDRIIRRILDCISPEDRAAQTSANAHGDTALRLYAESNSYRGVACLDIIGLLVNAGCDPNEPNSHGQTIAHIALLQCADVETMPGLSELGVDLHHVDNQGRPMIHYAVKACSEDDSKQEAVIGYLVDQRVDLHDGCSDCQSALMKVSRK
ncbi:ankyrin repeat-containing domain protein [Aspergillus varians]